MATRISADEKSMMDQLFSATPSALTNQLGSVVISDRSRPPAPRPLNRSGEEEAADPGVASSLDRVVVSRPEPPPVAPRPQTAAAHPAETSVELLYHFYALKSV